MKEKIVLITPPDIFENSNLSVLFVHLNEQDQDIVSKWLAETEHKENMNFYVYDGQDNIDWFFYAANRCEYKYIDLDYANSITQNLASYMLGKNNFYYKTSNDNLAALFSFINNNRISKIETFLERIISGQR